ncbi:MAG: NAD-dependent epimerase/dehydratase family protein, partial [Acidobacteriota bacterium]
MPIPELAGAAVLVTGGAGFIGSHLADALLERGARVRVLDSLVNGKLANLRRWLPAGGEGDGFCDDVSLFGRLEFRRGDIRDLDACRRCCEGVKLVFHQAALGSVPRSLADPATTIAVNVTGTANLFAAARDAGVERIIFASSSSVYGDSELLPKREGEEGRPLSPYALSKVQNEQLAE